MNRIRLAIAVLVATTTVLLSFASTVKVNPSDNKRKAFPLRQGFGSAAMTLVCDAPWRIKESSIIARDSESLWKRISPTEYRLSNAYAPQEYVMINGVFAAQGGGKRQVLPQFRVTSPAIDLQWASSCGDAAEESKEDAVPAALLVSSDRSKHRYLVVKGAKDKNANVGGRVSLSWTNPQCVKVWRKLQNGQESQIASGYKFTSLTSERLRIEPVSVSTSTIKFTARGEEDDYSKDQVEDSVYAFTYDLYPTNVKFNYDTASTSSDGVNLRKNYGIAYNISNGEWTRQDGAIAPVCYRMNQPVKIKVKFGTTSSFLTTARICAENVVDAGDRCFTSFDEKAVSFQGKATEYIEFAMSGNMLQKMFLSEGETLKWVVSEINSHAMGKVSFYETGPHKVYVILDNPVAPWSNSGLNNQNAWTDALDFVMNSVACANKSSDADVLRQITRYLFLGHGLIYETKSGSPKYAIPTDNQVRYDLTGYINKSNGRIINCYDQAAGVVSLGALSGIVVRCCFMNPYGYISTTELVGIGACNNPFFESEGCLNKQPVVDEDSVYPNRTLFGNHMFAVKSGCVYDACVKPFLGEFTCKQYILTAIDVSTPAESTMAGNLSDIWQIGIVLDN